uniref:LKB1 serine/threonine kinase interacting protein 1 N-terminal domain-containing protein n=1 Tax=Glossina austeni TaxID=7395 RepID=A0A1A9VG98_GLOAU
MSITTQLVEMRNICKNSERVHVKYRAQAISKHRLISMECGDAKNFQVLKTINSKSSVFRDLQLIYDFVQKTPQLCIHLSLRHNELFSIKAIKWLPNLKTLDLSFNILTQIPQFQTSATIETKVRSFKKKVNKTRTVEFNDNSSYDIVDETSDLQRSVEAKNMSQPVIIDEKQNQEYLDTKHHIETLRKKYSNEWLQADNAEMINSAIGIEPSNTSSNINIERHKAPKLLSELLHDLTITENIAKLVQYAEVISCKDALALVYEAGVDIILTFHHHRAFDLFPSSSPHVESREPINTDKNLPPLTFSRART